MWDYLPLFAKFFDSIIMAWWMIHFLLSVSHWLRKRYLPRPTVKLIHITLNTHLAIFVLLTAIPWLVSYLYFGLDHWKYLMLGVTDLWIAWSIYSNKCHYCLYHIDDDDDGFWEKVKDWITITPQRQGVKA